MELTDASGVGFVVGDALGMRLRIKSIDKRRGMRTYFWKGVPAKRPRSDERRVGKSVSVSVGIGGRRIIKKKKLMNSDNLKHLNKKATENVKQTKTTNNR